MDLVVDPKSVAKVLDKLPVPTICLHCGGPVSLVKNDVLYGKLYGTWPYAYACNDVYGCNSYVGLHPGTDIPLGTLADNATRAARMRAKEAFNPLWEPIEGFRSDAGKRTAAYAWLATQLGIPAGACHIGWFDKQTCDRVVAICEGRP